jgi:hypothetical protein
MPADRRKHDDAAIGDGLARSAQKSKVPGSPFFLSNRHACMLRAAKAVQLEPPNERDDSSLPSMHQLAQQEAGENHPTIATPMQHHVKKQELRKVLQTGLLWSHAAI